MIPFRVHHHVCAGCIMWYTAEFTNDGMATFVVKSYTFWSPRNAFRAALDHWSDIAMAFDTCSLAYTHMLYKPAWCGRFWKYMEKSFGEEGFYDIH